MAKAPWEVADEDEEERSPVDDGAREAPPTKRRESGGGDDSWMAGTGVDTDMEGDARPNNNIRFWMPKGKDTHVIFLTEAKKAPVVWEHQVKVNGNWRNWATCLQGTMEYCPLCEFADENEGHGRRYKAAFFTILDLSEYTNKKGEVVKSTKRLLCAKKDLTEILNRRYTTLVRDGHDLQYTMFKVYRKTSDKSLSSGDDYEIVSQVDPAKIRDKEEFDYREILRPNPDYVKDLIRKLNRGGGGGGGGPAKGEREVMY